MITQASDEISSLSALLQKFPEEIEVDPASVSAKTLSPEKCLVVIDDDPTGSQSVSNIPVITQWSVADFDWAFKQGLGAVFVLLNTRAETSEIAAKLNTEAVQNALASASNLGIKVSFVSRGDSTLRGHFPEETDAIASAWAASARKPNQAILLVPAFPLAGRVTIDGIHYLREGDKLTPVGLTEFAKDATFGYTNSRISEYVEEKTHGRIRSESVSVINLATIRSTAEQIAEALLALPSGSVAAIDAVTENDLRMLALGICEAEKQGATFLFRTGPTFVGAWVGQKNYQPLNPTEIQAQGLNHLDGGLIVIGSHVQLTNKQLEFLRAEYPGIREIEITPSLALQSNFGADICAELASELARELESGNVILRTSRELLTGASPEQSLEIAKSVSKAVSEIVNATLKKCRPRFVVAKGGITSNDVASKGLEVKRAIVVGPMLPGLVSLWKPIDGVAVGVPYVVFPGNVGDETALAKVVNRLAAKQ